MINDDSDLPIQSNVRQSGRVTFKGSKLLSERVTTQWIAFSRQSVLVDITFYEKQK